MQVDAEATHAWHTPGRIGDATFPERALRVRRQLREDDVFDVRAVNHRPAAADHLALNPQRRRLAGDHQQIARAALRDEAQPCFEPGSAGHRRDAQGFQRGCELVEIV